MNTIRATLTHKLFHNDCADSFGSILLNVAQGRVRFGKSSFNDRVTKLHDSVLREIKPMLRRQVLEYLKDTRYCIMWNENLCLETQFKLL